MKRNFDFIISKEEGFDKKVLRFYPLQSKVHGYDDESPKEWKEVYKTYMSFSVLHYYEDYESDGKYERPYELFSFYRDEGEGLIRLRDILFEIIFENNKETYNILPFGDGIAWELSRDKGNIDGFMFNMVNNSNGQCYRFYLKKPQIKEFYEVLTNFLEYMLKHSVGI